MKSNIHNIVEINLDQFAAPDVAKLVNAVFSKNTKLRKFVIGSAVLWATTIVSVEVENPYNKFGLESERIRIKITYIDLNG